MCGAVAAFGGNFGSGTEGGDECYNFRVPEKGNGGGCRQGRGGKFDGLVKGISYEMSWWDRETHIQRAHAA